MDILASRELNKLSGCEVFQRHREAVQALVDRATDAREQASPASTTEDRIFWLDMEERWLRLAESSHNAEWINELLRSQPRR